MVLFTILLLIFLATVASVIATKLKLPVEILLLLVSLLISFVPNQPIIDFTPDTFLLLFLPPIIFSAAFSTSWRDFVANKRPILQLSTGLILFVMAFVASALKYLIPNLSWALCFLFGAIVSPTDASSAIALVKKLIIPKRITTIIEGESLINDATALIAYRYALIAVTTGTWSFWFAGLHFLLAAIIAIGLGLGIGFISLRIYIWLAEPKVQSIFSLIIPYFTYIVADQIGISAIICLVSCGIYISRNFPKMITPESRYAAETIWEVYIFLLNALVFILIGLQLPAVMKGLNQFSISQLAFFLVIINIVVILSRFMWVYPAAYIPRFLSARLRRQDPYPHWSELAILGWIGMRGVLSLILVMSLPKFLPLGQPFPQRSLLILLTYSVILTTVLLPTFTLPLLSKIFNFKKDTQHRHEEAQARVAVIKVILHELEKARREFPDIASYIEPLHQRYVNRLAILQSNLHEFPYSTLHSHEQKIRQLTKRLLNAERHLLITLRAQGAIHDEVFHQLQKELDLDDLKLKNMRI